MTHRRRVACELLILAVLAITFLLLFPRRPIFVDIGFALFALGFVLLNMSYTRSQIWGQWRHLKSNEHSHRMVSWSRWC